MSMRILIAFSALCLPLLGLLPATRAQEIAAPEQAPKAAAKDASDYLRVLRDDDSGDPIAMETSIVSFRPQPNSKLPADLVVDLIGAVHVADQSYYQQLNEVFVNYEALLYELVAPDDHNVPVDGESRHPVGQLQQGLKSILGLSFQLEEVDYRRKNFVHADMSPEEFSRVMTERGESFLEMMFRMMGQAIATSASKGKATDADIVMALFARDRPLRLKRVMCTQFEDLDGTMQVLEGPNGSTLIGQRNRKALSVMDREIKAGKKRIGVFYGAGHMPDMAKRLAADFGLVPDTSSVRWLTAWNMQD